MVDKRKQEVWRVRDGDDTPCSQTRGACVAYVWADVNRTKPKRNAGAHHVSHTTICEKTGQIWTASPPLIRVWKRRHWIEYCFRTLKHLLATGAWQVHSEDAYYGHLVLRLMGCFVLFYTSQVICKGQLTMEEIIFSLKHYWRFVDSEALELKALSLEMGEKAA
jgi:hypothetical protein